MVPIIVEQRVIAIAGPLCQRVSKDGEGQNRYCSTVKKMYPVASKRLL